MPVRATCFALVAALAISTFPLHAAVAAPLDIPLAFGSLPSAQGFTYVATGAHAGVPEASVFSVGGAMLTQNTIGQYVGTSGAGIYYQRLNGITTTEPKQIRVSARCSQVTGSSVFPSGEGGLCFVFTTGSVQYGFTIMPTRLAVLQASWSMAPGTFDNTQFHDYVFDWSAGGSWRLYRDGVLVHSGSGGSAVAANRVLFGDGTGGANALGDLRAFRFIQDTATPATASTWGRIKNLYR
jgi:hypothetical protein